MEAFARAPPGCGRAATSYVPPGADPPNRLFNQPALARRKLTYLATNGYEIGNHTLWHANLSRYRARRPQPDRQGPGVDPAPRARLSTAHPRPSHGGLPA